MLMVSGSISTSLWLEGSGGLLERHDPTLGDVVNKKSNQSEKAYLSNISPLQL